MLPVVVLDPGLDSAVLCGRPILAGQIIASTTQRFRPYNKYPHQFYLRPYRCHTKHTTCHLTTTNPYGVQIPTYSSPHTILPAYQLRDSLIPWHSTSRHTAFTPLVTPMPTPPTDPSMACVLSAVVAIGTIRKTLDINFQRLLEVLFQYAHISNPVRLASIWYNMDTSRHKEFWPDLKDGCHETVQHIGLYPPFITHGVAEMVSDS